MWTDKYTEGITGMTKLPFDFRILVRASAPKKCLFLIGSSCYMYVASFFGLNSAHKKSDMMSTCFRLSPLRNQGCNRIHKPKFRWPNLMCSSHPQDSSVIARLSNGHFENVLEVLHQELK